MSNPLEKLKDEAKNGFEARFDSPFVSAYSISFLIWNYQIILYLTSNYEATNKHSLIKRSLNFESFVIPALITIFILIILPKLLVKAHEQYEANRTDIQNIKFKEQKRLIPTSAEIASLSLSLTQSNDKVIALQNLITDKDQEIGGWKNKLDDLQKHRLEQEQVIRKNSAQLLKHQEDLKKLKDEKLSLESEIQKLHDANRTMSSDPKVSAAIKYLMNANLYSTFLAMGERLILSAVPSNRFQKNDLSKLKAQKLITLSHAGNDTYIELSDLGENTYKQMIEDSAGGSP